MDGIKFVCPARVSASHTRLGALYSMAGLESPYACKNLLNTDMASTWNAGRFAPVSLTIDLGECRKVIGLIIVPDMQPKKGTVSLILRMQGDTAFTAHSSTWIDRKPVSIVWMDPVHTRYITLEFLHSPSWIALRNIEIALSAAAPSDYPARPA